MRSPQALVLAEKCGVAFQLTNIIRDVKEDQEKGRVYLPKEDRDQISGSHVTAGIRSFTSATVLCRIGAVDRHGASAAADGLCGH